MLTNQQLEEIRERDGAATLKCCRCARPANVQYAKDWVGGESVTRAEFFPYCAEHDPTKINLYHRDLAARAGQWRLIYKEDANTDIPALLAHVEALQAENERLREAVERAADTCRLQRESWWREKEDAAAYAAWTPEIEYYEGLLESQPEPVPPQLATTESARGVWVSEE